MNSLDVTIFTILSLETKEKQLLSQFVVFDLQQKISAFLKSKHSLVVFNCLNDM